MPYGPLGFGKDFSFFSKKTSNVVLHVVLHVVDVCCFDCT